MKYLKLYEDNNEDIKSTYDDFSDHIDDFEITKTGIDCDGWRLSSLDGLEDIENLEDITYFCCDNNELKSLSGIELLVNLKELRCGWNNLTSLEGIENLTKLEQLYCHDNKLTSIKEIEKLTKLKNIHISDNQIINLKGIENCRNLKYLWCYNNKLSNLDELKKIDIYVEYAHNNFTKPVCYKYGKSPQYSMKEYELFGTYEFQKNFIEDTPENVKDLEPIGFHKKIMVEYTDLLKFFDII